MVESRKCQVLVVGAGPGGYVAAIRAFDRVMLHNYYWLPMMSKTNHAIVYWDKFGIPNHGRLQRLGFLDLWWWNEEKASRVARYAGDDS